MQGKDYKRFTELVKSSIEWGQKRGLRLVSGRWGHLYAPAAEIGYLRLFAAHEHGMKFCALGMVCAEAVLTRWGDVRDIRTSCAAPIGLPEQVLSRLHDIKLDGAESYCFICGFDLVAGVNPVANQKHPMYKLGMHIRKWAFDHGYLQ